LVAVKELIIKEAISLYVETLEEEGEPVPDDSQSLEYSLTFAS